MLISLVINLDSRPERNEFGGVNLTGVCNTDFMEYGVYNKQKFLKGFGFETIVYIDKHLEIPQETLDYLYKICDVVCIRNHTEEEKFNDYNYLRAISLASGDIIMHMDSDLSVFTSSQEPINEMIGLLDKYDYISYPSQWTPNPTVDHNYDYYWCSTRFFLCKKETLDFTEIKKCLSDMDYMYSKYPASVKNPWLEHTIALISKYTGKGVFYPPIDYEKCLIFCWDTYERYVLRRLNELSYNEVKDWVISKGGIYYPNQVKCN